MPLNGTSDDVRTAAWRSSRVWLPGMLLLASLAMFVAAVGSAGSTATGDREATTQSEDAVVAAQSLPRALVPNVARDGPTNTFAYTVQSGDTLFSIAQRHGTTVATLQRLNDVADPSQLQVGAVLFIPLPTPTPLPTGPSVRIDHGPRGTNKVALTFDMGGRVDPALDIMNWLVANNVQATIFMTGAMADNVNHDEGRRVLAIIDRNRHLFELGNHSYTHPDFRNLTATEMRNELTRTEQSVAKYTSLSMRPLFRPPFGAVDSRVLGVLGPAGYPYTIMWDVDSGDWRPIADGGPTASQMVTRVVNNAQGGSIVVMHLGGYVTYDALPGIVQGLKGRGFQLVKVSELLP